MTKPLGSKAKEVDSRVVSLALEDLIIAGINDAVIVLKEVLEDVDFPEEINADNNHDVIISEFTQRLIKLFELEDYIKTSADKPAKAAKKPAKATKKIKKIAKKKPAKK